MATKNETASPKVETPVTTETAAPASAPETSAPANESDLEKQLAALKAKKDEQAKHIADLEASIKAAHAKRKKYMDGTDEDSIAVREFMAASRPNVWKSIQEDPEMFEAELKEYKLSILTPEQKDLATKWDALQTEKNAITARETELRAEITTKYPDFFGPVKAPKAASAPKDGTAAPAGDVVPFTGTMLSKDDAAKKVDECIAKGITSESAIIQEIYGKDFTITNSKPRFQIHSIRVEKGLVSKKG